MADRPQLFSVLIALGCLAVMEQREGWAGVLALLPLLALALGMIWYAGNISRAIGRGWGLHRAERPTPPAAIRALGWVLLMMPLLVFVLQRLRAG
ncbi:MAG: hypothetical protein Q8L65_05190 [Burkholderiales bacterium]|nr:hypothetical protein [Burkholderiales bacterium]MDP2397829.1 hypothetical protein [Burkholderiales bacterium]